MPYVERITVAQDRAASEERRAADRSREAGLLGYAAGQRAKIAAGTYTPSRDWTPRRTELGDWISRSVSGIDPDAGATPVAPVGDPAQEWAWRQTDLALRTALGNEDPDAIARFAQIADQFDPNMPQGQSFNREGQEIDAQGDPL